MYDIPSQFGISLAFIPGASVVIAAVRRHQKLL